MSVPGPLARASAQEWMRLEGLTKKRLLTAQTEPCFAWYGPERMRFRGKRWIPRRLFFTLAGNDEADIDGKTLVPTCGTSSCVWPSHQQIVPYKPPTPGKKRKATVEPPHANPYLNKDKMARVREELRRLQETLARLDAAEAALPPELQGTEAADDLLRDALGDHAPNGDLVPDIDDILGLPAQFAENPYETLFGNL